MLTSPFNAPRDYSSFGGLKNDRHEGADFDVTEITPDSKASVLCTYDGTIARISVGAGYGNYVIVKHKRNGSLFYTWHTHLDKIYIAQDKVINKGDAIGEIGATGNVTGEHIHFNLQVPDYGLSGYIIPDVVDPLPYF